MCIRDSATTDEDKKNGFSHLRPQKVIDRSAFGSASFAAEAIYSAVCLISTGLSIFALVQAVIQGAEQSAQFFTKAFAPFKLSKRSERINLSGCAPHGQAFVQGASRHKRQRALSSIAVFFTNGISISPFLSYALFFYCDQKWCSQLTALFRIIVNSSIIGILYHTKKTESY